MKENVTTFATILTGLALCVGCTQSRPKAPMFHVISADPCDLQLIGIVGSIKYILKTEESYVTDAAGNKHLTSLTKAEYDEQFKKWEANKTPKNLPTSSVCAGLRMDTVGQDFPVIVDNQRGEIVISVPDEKQTTTFMIEHEEEAENH